MESVVDCGSMNDIMPWHSLPYNIHLQVQSLSWEVYQD
jgi:hypothetical protein